jgi:hypothetical protein
MTVAQKKAYLLHVCGRWGTLLKKETSHGLSILYGGLRCNSWLCPRCRKRRSRQFASATLAFFKGARLSHLTITDRPGLSAQESFATFSKRWNHFRTLLTRGGRKFSYVRVIEEQPGTGRAHYHILCKEYIPPDLLKASLKAAGFGYIYNIHECSDVEAYYYVAKYLNKEWPNEEAFQYVIDYNIRIVSGSRGFRLAPRIKQGWEVVLKLCNHVTGRRYTKTFIFVAASEGAKLSEHVSSDLTDRFEFKLSDALGDAATAKFWNSLHDALPIALKNGVTELSFEELNRFIDSQLGLDTYTGCM